VTIPFEPTLEPWKLAHSSYANAPFVIYVGDIHPNWNRRYPLSGVDWIAEVKHDESEEHERQIANARLILAAPRMLHLLRHLRDNILHCGIRFDNADQQAGFDSAARAVAVKRVAEFLRELEGGTE
jgi:hypothetical protein